MIQENGTHIRPVRIPTVNGNDLLALSYSSVFAYFDLAATNAGPPHRGEDPIAGVTVIDSVGRLLAADAQNLASDVADAGYRGLMAGRRVVVPGWANKVITVLTHLVPRGILLAATDRHNRGR